MPYVQWLAGSAGRTTVAGEQSFQGDFVRAALQPAVVSQSLMGHVPGQVEQPMLEIRFPAIAGPTLGDFEEGFLDEVVALFARKVLAGEKQKNGR
jgi:hypothetical protein